MNRALSWIVVTLVSASAIGADEMPDFLTGLARKFARESADTAPLEIWSYCYRGSTVFYVAPQYCCDLPGVLYDESGQVICNFGGGIANVYDDGNCPGFADVRATGQLLWQHPDRSVD
jgi:hypothetical protein